MSIKTKKPKPTCKYCGSYLHYSYRCFQNPKRKTYKLQTRKPIRKVGKQGLKWMETRAEWIAENGKTHDCHYCGILVSDDTFLLESGQAQKLTLDHTESRSRRPEFRYDKKKLVPSCSPCNTSKGSLSHDEYVHICPFSNSPTLSPAAP